MLGRPGAGAGADEFAAPPPPRHGRAPAAWPRLDRAAWERANQGGDLLSERGPAAGWRASTRRTAGMAYGNWLPFLRDGGRLDASTPISSRFTLKLSSRSQDRAKKLNDVAKQLVVVAGAGFDREL